VIRSYGVNGLRDLLREHIRLGQRFAEWVRADPRFEVLGEPRLATVCFRLAGNGSAAEQDGRNRDLLARINAGGRFFLTGTMLHGRYVLRLALGHLNTQEADVREVWEAIGELAARS